LHDCEGRDESSRFFHSKTLGLLQGKGLHLLLALIPTDDLLHFLLEDPDLRKGGIYDDQDNQNEYAKRQPEPTLLRHGDLALPQVDAENRFYVIFIRESADMSM
jgi:hypothetical protein